MDKARMISVVIPTYNRCDRLRVALDAVCSQGVDALEVIVVDNNSSDGTASMVKAYPEARVKYTLCAKQGIFHALNHGLALTTGDYLTWTSDDNWFHPGALRDLAGTLESSGADFVYSDYISLDEESGQQILSAVAGPEELDRHCVVGACFMFRRRLYERLGGFSLRYRFASDYDYWLKVWRAGFRMLPMSSPRYTFTYHPSSASRTRNSTVGAETVRVRLAHGSYPRLWNRLGDPALAAESLRDAYLLCTHGYFTDALVLAVQAVCHRPLSPAFWRRCLQIARRVAKTGPAKHGPER
jgi:glycosyltransferase involved in cell wall biosynthesis